MRALTAIRTCLSRGSWLTPERLRLYPRVILAIEIAALAFLALTSDGRHDWFGRPLGTDFAQVWIAGTEILAGHPEQPYDLAAHLAGQRDFFGAATDVYGWHYPPYFLALAGLLALLPYALALAVWQGATLAIYAASIRATLRTSGLPWRDVLIAALAFPAAFVNIAHGHNGFLTAALFAGALLRLERRPIVAGLLFALLAYKPQFGLVIPVALIAGRHWRALIAAGAAIFAMTAATMALFGVRTWQAFADSLAFTRSVVLEDGNTGWEKIQTIFAAVRMLGGSVQDAYAAQAIVCAVIVAAIAWLWHSGADRRLKAAALLCAALLATPYSLDYDMVLLGPAIAFMVAHGLERGFAPLEKTVLAAMWLTPLVARLVAKLSYFPLGVAVTLALFATIVWRASRTYSTSSTRHTARAKA